MTELNPHAAKLTEKYIKTTIGSNSVDSRKKRGLQAEINKLEAIHRTIITNNIDAKELLRIKIELNKLYSTVQEKLSNT